MRQEAVKLIVSLLYPYTELFRTQESHVLISMVCEDVLGMEAKRKPRKIRCRVLWSVCRRIHETVCARKRLEVRVSVLYKREYAELFHKPSVGQDQGEYGAMY